MSHIFISPHPDDAALSCGGLIANLRELGQNVIILTVYSGTGALDALTPYQRQALGFGGKAIWPATEAFDRGSIAADHDVPGETDAGLAAWQAEPSRLAATQRDADASAKEFWQRASWYRRADISATTLPRGRSADASDGQGANEPGAVAIAAAAGDAMAQRRMEDERYALFAEASVVFLDLADAVFRGYEGDEQLFGAVRAGDDAPVDLLRREIARLEPQRVYFPLGVGNHVDHVLMRRTAAALLAEGRAWEMPGPDWASRIAFYEDFPYAYWQNFDVRQGLAQTYTAELPSDISLAPEITDVAEVLEQKVQGIARYASQVTSLFGSVDKMADAVRTQAAAVALSAGRSGAAERYWSAVRRG
ncbi:MAG: PIG-L family deacetylase [Chloroflexota bacterium]